MADLVWLSDAQGAVIEPFMPKDQPGPARKDDRQIISGILFDPTVWWYGRPPHRGIKHLGDEN